MERAGFDRLEVESGPFSFAGYHPSDRSLFGLKPFVGTTPLTLIINYDTY